jgi:hypothetical protein
MSKRWDVTLPITGTVNIEVEAETESEAIDKAIRRGPTEDEAAAAYWEFHRHVVKGNVCYAVQNEAEAREILELERLE